MNFPPMIDGVVQACYHPDRTYFLIANLFLCRSVEKRGLQAVKIYKRSY
jgi:hypothetical protein